VTDRCINFLTFVTLPNLVSCSRFALIPAIGWSIVNDIATLSFGLFLVVVVSDFLDGIIARRTGQETRLGTLLDHGADATFVVSITAIFAWIGLLPWLLPPLIALAFLQYILDSHVFAGATLRPSVIGRWNGIAYFVITGCAIFVHHFSTDAALTTALMICGWLLVGTTIVSITERAIHLIRAPLRS
jgi:cardiolipin synthase